MTWLEREEALEKEFKYCQEFNEFYYDYYVKRGKGLDEYTKRHTEYHNNFNLTCDIKNKYNRMVSWKAGTLHGDPITNKMSKRLTQYFFVERK